jgi:phosphoribosyl-AMP cyclohydrolase
VGANGSKQSKPAATLFRDARLALTLASLATGEAWYYSRSRRALWKKGETSGHVQRVVEMRVDCDQDVLLLKVKQAGAGACHTGRRTCFYRLVVPGAPGMPAALEFRDAERGFDPAQVYGAGTQGSSGT